MAGKSRARPSFKKHTRRYKGVIPPVKVLEGQNNLSKKRGYASLHGYRQLTGFPAQWVSQCCNRLHGALPGTSTIKTPFA